MGTKALVVYVLCLKWLVTAALRSSESFCLEKWAWRAGAHPYIEPTDSLITEIALVV